MIERLLMNVALAAGLLAGCGDDEDGGSGSSSSSSMSGAGASTSSSSNTGGGDVGGGAAAGGGGGGGAGGAGNGGGNPCSAALEQALGPIDEISEGEVNVLATTGTTTTLYVDASAGGIMNQAENPWIYVRLSDATKVEVTDITAFTSTEWDLAMKRPVLRSNSGDSGPGNGGAVFVDKPFADVTMADATDILIDDWFDEMCMLGTDPTGAILTTFSGWYDYDMSTMVLTPHPGTFIVRGGDGALYKLAILDYYATPDGGTGMAGGRYKLDVAPLP